MSYIFKTCCSTVSFIKFSEQKTPPTFTVQLFRIMEFIPDRETSKTLDNLFVPSVLSSVSFSSKSCQLCPEEEGKLRTSASRLPRDMAGILTEGVRVIWQDKPHVLLEYSKNVQPSLWLVSSVHHSVFSLTVMHCVGGIETECLVKLTKEGSEGKQGKEREKRSQTRDLFGRTTCLELAGDAIESDTPGWSCQTATSCPLYSHIAGV